MAGGQVWLIAGPTASGKSALALELARRESAIIINTDSMQVYDGLRIITARPNADDMAAADHRLYGHLDPAVAHSTGAWAREIAALLEQLRPEQPLIFVGGTGLYFKALLVGLSKMPDVADRVRERWRYRLAEEGASRLHRILRAQDPDMALQLHPSDGQRIVRALEVMEVSGRSISTFQGQRPNAGLIGERPRSKIVLTPDRDWLKARIRDRFEQMLCGGGLEEVGTFLERGLDPSLPAMKAIGVDVGRQVLDGRLTIEEAVERGAIETRQYAKRQITWFRNQFDDDWKYFADVREAFTTV
ncbi:MAG: tRNA (adenosine(37)-N6)-dimethylallyltransferase MiaA [Pseudomonadota bacterium]